MNDSYRAAPRRPVELRTIAGPAIRALLLELRVQVGAAVEADLELAGADYDRCRREGQLGLDAPGRGPGPEPEPDRAVRVVVGLRPHLADALAGEAEPMEALLQQLLTDEPGELAHADAWRALDVTQSTGGQPELRIGFRTGWADADRVGPMETIARAALEGASLAFDEPAEGLLRAGAAGPFTYLVRVQPALGLLAVYAVHEALVPAARRAHAAVELARLSAELPAGGFDLDPDDGEVRFRLDHLTATPVIGLETTSRMLGYVTEVMNEHAPALAALASDALD